MFQNMTRLFTTIILSFTAFGFPNPAVAQSCAPAPAGLVSWWPADGNALDVRSRNNGALQNGATFAAGHVGQAFDVNGTNEVVVADSPSLNFGTGSFTVETWTRADSFPGPFAAVVAKGIPPGTNRWMLFRGPFGNFPWRVILNSGTTTINAISDADALTGQYTHLAFVVDRTSAMLKFYVNGVLQNSQPSIAGLGSLDSTLPLRIGNDGEGSFFDGQIDETSIYNRALSQSEIQAIFNAGQTGKCKPTATVAPAGQVGWWPGDGDAREISGNNLNGTLGSGNGFAIGKVSQAFNLSATPGVVVQNNPALNQQNFTIELWATATNYLCSPPGSCQAFLVDKSGSNGLSGYSLGVRENGTLRFLLNGGAGGADIITTQSVADGNFHHIVGSYDGAMMKVFLDGVLINQREVVATINFEANSPYHIGSRQLLAGSTFPYRGKIDEVSFYNRSLTDAEITSIFNAGLAGKLKSATTPTGTNVSTNVGSDATINFPTVSAAGVTQQIPLDQALFALPAGFAHTGLAYDIDTAATTSGDITISFHLPSFNDPMQFGLLKVLHQEGSLPTFVDRTVSQNFAARTLTAIVPSLSAFVIATGSSPTEVTLASFAATGYDRGVLLEWQTGLEVDNLGFRIYRDAAGKRVLLNSQLVAGSALRADSTLQSGGRYSWWDAGIADCGLQNADCKNTAYWLEDIDLKGESTWHGPFYVKQVGGAAPLRANAELLGEGARINRPEGATRAVERAAATPRASRMLEAAHASLASESAARIQITGEGWYRITRTELASIGFDTRVDPRLLQLFVDGREMPMLVRGGEDGSFDAGDSIEFYGIGVDSPYSEARAYWLAAGTRPGLRVRRAERQSGEILSFGFASTVERKDRTIYFSALKNGERENFFGAVVAGETVEQSLSIRHLDASPWPEAILEVTLQGVTAGPHRVGVSVNGAQAGEIIFDGQSLGAAKLRLPHSLLREGENVLKLTAQAGERDISLVDSIRLTYRRTYTADANALRFTAVANQQVTINGFTSSDIRVFDVTDPLAILELPTEVRRQKGDYAVTITAPETGERHLLALTVNRSVSPAGIFINRPSSWRQAANAADLVVITRRDFFSSIERLAALRQRQGLKVAVVDIEDIYDEFSYGQKTPQAVKDFLAYARSNWKQSPRYALFAADSSFDPKNYLGFGEWDLVPTKLVDTYYMETASDDWFADFNDDAIAEIALGRLPARTPEEAALMVEKIISYESSAPAQEILLVADANDGYDFERANEELASLIPSGVRVSRINRGLVGEETARKSLLEAVHRGQRIVNYTGHGSVDVWRGELLTVTDAAGIRNESLPVFVMMTCLNGYFHDAGIDSLSEGLMKAERGGAVAVWASSGMTLPSEQEVMNRELYGQIFGQARGVRLGEAVMRAKAAINDLEIRRTWILIGDPTSRLK